MQAQTLALALVAALYPVGLLAVSLLLASDRPMTLGLSFYGGAATILFVVGILVITVLHGADLSSTSTRAAFYQLRPHLQRIVTTGVSAGR